MGSVASLVILLFAMPAGAATIGWVAVTEPGNAPDSEIMIDGTTGYGSVAYNYYISKYEVTNAQYVEFLNAKAASDPLGLYNTSMDSDNQSGGITRSGSSGSYSYTVKAGFADKPATYVSFFDALRFSNWLNNGQGTGDTESGAYTLLGGTARPSNGTTVTRNGGAITFLASENEWYKAAYYSTAGVYFDYPAGTDSVTACVVPASDTGNSANCDSAVRRPTNVGEYALSEGPYGTFDQGGNVWEWNEEIVSVSQRGIRGGGWSTVTGDATNLAASARGRIDPAFETAFFGFRVASVVPEPDTGLLVMVGLLGLAAQRRRCA